MPTHTKTKKAKCKHTFVYSSTELCQQIWYHRSGNRRYIYLSMRWQLVIVTFLLYWRRNKNETHVISQGKHKKETFSISGNDTSLPVLIILMSRVASQKFKPKKKRIERTVSKRKKKTTEMRFHTHNNKLPDIKATSTNAKMENFLYCRLYSNASCSTGARTHQMNNGNEEVASFLWTRLDVEQRSNKYPSIFFIYLYVCVFYLKMFTYTQLCSHSPTLAFTILCGAVLLLDISYAGEQKIFSEHSHIAITIPKKLIRMFCICRSLAVLFFLLFSRLIV